MEIVIIMFVPINILYDNPTRAVLFYFPAHFHKCYIF